MMKFEESISISATPKEIFAVYAAVAQWPIWDAEVEHASLVGDFKLGVEGKIKPKGAPESKIKITELTESKSFTVECKLPLCKMRFVHVIVAEGAGSRVINSTEFTGLLAPVFGRLIGKSIAKTMPATLAGLKRHVEHKG
jgi:hypothetical protein